MERVVDSMNLSRRANPLILLILLSLSFFVSSAHSQSAQINAYVGGSYGGGGGFSLSTSAPLEYSPTSSVNSLNAQSALWLLTCPNSPGTPPSPGSSPQYFNNNPPAGQDYSGGNQCFTHPGSGQFDVVTTATLSPSYYGGYSVTRSGLSSSSTSTSSLLGTPLTSSIAPVSGATLLTINALAFGAQVDGYVSDIFSRNLNIFQQAPSANLHLLWTWFGAVPHISSDRDHISYSPAYCDRSNNCVGEAQQKTTNAGSYQTIYMSSDASGGSVTTTCNYPTYTYSSDVRVSGFSNSYIPYLEVTGASSSASPPSSTRLGPDPKLFPYLTYTLSIPSLFSQTLQVPYYLFSPAKYLFSANELDALPIAIGGQLFASIKNAQGQSQLAMGTQESLPTWTSSNLKTTVTNPGVGSSSSSGGVCAAPSLADALLATTGSSFYDPNNPPPYPFPGAGGYLNSLYCNFCQSNQGSSLCSHSEFMQYMVDCTGQTYPSTYGDNGGLVALGNLEPTPAYCQPFSTVQSSVQQITNPISIVSLPTDYTYILYKDNSGNYGIDVLRAIPSGRYDVGIPAVPAAPDSQIWDAEWQQYWKQVIQLQNDNMYLQSQPSIPSGFTPLNLTVDYIGDIFLTGTMADSSGNIQPAVAEIVGPSNPSQASFLPQIVTTTSSTSGQSKDWPMPEIAVAPGGKYVFLANQSDGGYIYQYAINTASDGSLSVSKTPQPVSLAYQQQDSTTGKSSMLNIVYWLEHQGLYNQKLQFINDFIATYLPQSGQQPVEVDSPLYHHPVGIQDVNGYLYILDNWAGGLDVVQQSCPGIGQCNYNGVFFSIMTMRIINSSGLNVPLNPTMFNDLYSTKAATCILTPAKGTTAPANNCYSAQQPQPTCAVPPSSGDTTTQCGAPISTTCAIPGSYQSGKPQAGSSYVCTTPITRSSTYTSLSVPTAYGTNIYPPYGWFISANITTTQLQDEPQAGFGTPIYGLGTLDQPAAATTVTFCDSTDPKSCTFNPHNLNAAGYSGTFNPIGPEITALNMSQVQGIGGAFVPRAISSSADVRTKWAPIYYNTGFSVGFNESISLLFTGAQFSPTEPEIGYTLHSTNPNTYNALILAGFGAQNYTNFFAGDPLFTCYTDSLVPSDCKHLDLIKSMLAPIYNMPDPLKFNENLGGSQQLAFSGAVASSLPSSSSLPTATPSCVQAIAQGTVCNGGSSIAGTSSSAQSTITSSTLPVTLVPVQQSATVTINGQVLIPYSYSSTTSQSWTAFSGGTCTTVTKSPAGRAGRFNINTVVKTDQSLSSPLISPPTSVPASSQGGLSPSSVLYTYGAGPVFANTIVAPLEGGGTYLQDLLGKYYQQNLSDIGTMLSPQLAYNINSNRQIPDTLVNITTNNLHGGDGRQYILNSTHALQYMINTYTQGGNPGYQTIVSRPYALAQNGLAAAVNVLSNTNPADPSAVNQNYLGQNTIYGIIPQAQSVANLFNFYISMANSNINSFYMSNTILTGVSGITYQALGYNRLTYLLRDRFNNTLSAPIDADISNPTQIALTVNPTVDQINANKTTLAISGSATYTINGQTQPVPVGSSIYVYYGKNINFALYSPLTDPTNAQSCAFNGAPNAQEVTSKLTTSCSPANPLTSDAQAATAAQQTYYTSYNSMGDCAPAPQHLLSSTSYNCNINDPITSKCKVSPQGNPQYCVPQASDGSGTCTSQLGLIGAAKTDANGAFSISTVACGIGSALIDSTYFGYPGPEPTTVAQTPLTLSSSPALTCAAGKCTQTTVVNNYYYAPTHTLKAVPIGIFELSYGQIGVAIIAFCVISAILLLLSKSNKAIYRRKRRIP
ncbi:MAG: hypothetical protein KGH53_00030 [Candidatus Micrarchaeota archaeon]|nr:hypothetical protein [Candidatus Micrarchaeota archaeon]